MENVIFNIIELVIGFSSGIIIGGAFIAILTFLGIIPRLIQLSKVEHLVHSFSAAVVFGALFGTYLSFTPITVDLHVITLMVWGIFQGIFNGMFAAALAEIINVFPLLSKRIGLEKYMLFLLMAIVFGKICGSLFQWLILTK